VRRVILIVRNIVIVAAIVAIGVAVVLWPPSPMPVPPQGLSISGVTIINPSRDRRPNQSLVVSGGTISSISERAPENADPRFRGAYVLPGLIDMHVHTPPPPANADIRFFFLMYLAHGVTTIRDMGNNGFMFRERADTLSGATPGPRIFTGGPIVDGDPPTWPSFSRVVRNAAEAGPVVDDLARQGADFVKVYDRLTPDALAGIEKAAKQHSLPVVGHVPELVRLEDAHIDDVQHLTGVSDAPLRIYDNPANHIDALAKSWETLDDARIQLIVNTSIAGHIAHTPTLVVNDRIFRPHGEQAQDPVAALVPAWYPGILWRSVVPPSQAGAFDEAARALHAQLPKLKMVVRRLHEADVTVHVGTDTLNPFVVPGESMREEMRNFLDAGYSPEQVWQAATAGNGASLPAKGLGIVQAGAPADFLIFKSDPTQSIDALDTLEAVIANGRLYTRADLDSALSRYRKRFDNPAYKFATMSLARLLVNANRQNDTSMSPEGKNAR
jgi:imidazolonepropionase-like amidohydrolase